MQAIYNIEFVSSSLIDTTVTAIQNVITRHRRVIVSINIYSPIVTHDPAKLVNNYSLYNYSLALLGRQQQGEFLNVNFTVVIGVSFSHHLVDVGIRQLFPNRGQHVSEFSSRNLAVTISVKQLERFSNFSLRVGVLHFSRHHGQEFGEIDGAVIVNVHFVDHVSKFRFRRGLPERPHDGTQFLQGDLAVGILVKELEDVLEFLDLFVGEFFRLELA